MLLRPARFAPLLAACLVAASSCGPPVNLATDIEVTDVETGWYDNGIRQGKTHLVPYISLRLRNVSDHEVSSVLLAVSFWRDGDDGEMDESQIRGIDSDGLAPGAETDHLVVRSEFGYTLEGARSEFFLHSDFVDATAKVFARRSGAVVPIGEYRLDRRIISPSSAPDAR
jgi:hypothetical protein